MPEMPTPAARITVTVDVPNCPVCGSPAKKMGLTDRACLGCGLTWEVLTERDELDAKADREVRSRGWNEERDRARKIGKVAHRW